MTVREKAELIVKDIKKEQGTNPVVIFKQIAEIGRATRLNSSHIEESRMPSSA